MIPLAASSPARPTEIGRRVGELAAKGITEIIYQPTGPDIPDALEAFHTAVRGCGTRPSRVS